MSGKFASCVVCAGCLVALAQVAHSSELLVGVENARYRADPVTDTISDSDNIVASHSWTAATLDWVLNKNIRLHLTLGGITSTIEDGVASATYTDDAGFRWSLGAELDQELDIGGAILLDFTFDKTTHDTKHWTYDLNRTAFKIAYAWFEPDRARPYAGLAYTTYDGSLDHDTVGLDRELEYEWQLNLLAGIRAKAETFFGVMEAIVGTELGVRLALEFGF